MRIWLSGPRILGGLIRPGISFSLSELTRLTQRGRAGLPVKREDVIISRKEGGLSLTSLKANDRVRRYRIETGCAR